MDDQLEQPGSEPEPSPYLRRQKQVEVRRARLRVRASARFWKALLAVLLLALLGFAGYITAGFLLRDPRFRLEESGLEMSGIKYVMRRQVAEKFAGDIGRSVLLVPLARRRAMLEEISWVESAAVARAWPNRLRITIAERVPVGFLRAASGLYLVDRHGVVMERPARATFNFPVITGFGERDSPEQRQQRMRLYLAMIEDLDSDGAQHSLDISEADLSDPEDARIIVPGRDASEAILVHLGNTNFLSRYQTYLAHIRQWRQQFEKIQSIDLRYERQVVVNPDRR
jgi:cell division protein FtsQ